MLHTFLFLITIGMCWLQEASFNIVDPGGNSFEIYIQSESEIKGGSFTLKGIKGFEINTVDSLLNTDLELIRADSSNKIQFYFHSTFPPGSHALCTIKIKDSTQMPDSIWVEDLVVNNQSNVPFDKVIGFNHVVYNPKLFMGDKKILLTIQDSVLISYDSLSSTIPIQISIKNNSNIPYLIKYASKNFLYSPAVNLGNSLIMDLGFSIGLFNSKGNQIHNQVILGQLTEYNTPEDTIEEIKSYVVDIKPGKKIDIKLGIVLEDKSLSGFNYYRNYFPLQKGVQYSLYIYYNPSNEYMYRLEGLETWIAKSNQAILLVE
jgi:hypothetical protein